MNKPLAVATRLLQLSLPSPLQTVALGVCVNADDASFMAWQKTIGVTAATRAILGGRTERLRRLLSLLYVRFQASDVVLDKSLLTYLRTARAREQLRTESVREICHRTLTCLTNAGISPIVLKGVAAAETLYPEPSMRHCHDLDVLLSLAEFPAASRALIDSGYAACAPPLLASTASQWFRDSSGFQIGLHLSLYRIASWDSHTWGAAQRAAPAIVADCNVYILSPHDALVHICCSGLTAGSAYSPCWAADAWYLLDRTGDAFDWEALVAAVAETDLVPPLIICLDYLRNELSANIPLGAVAQLRSLSGRQSRVDSMFRAALSGARQSPVALLRSVRRPADFARTAWWLVTSS